MVDMRITPIMISIPPYITAPWDSIAAVHAEKDREGLDVLVISLANDYRVYIPSLTQEEISSIASTYEKFIEGEFGKMSDNMPGNLVSNITEVFQQIFSSVKNQPTPVGVMSIPVFHSPSQSSLPILDKESLRRIIKTISAVSEAGGTTFLEGKPEKDCNCIYCQACRYVQATREEKEVSKESFEFSSQWKVIPIGNETFKVMDSLDAGNEYVVSLQPTLKCSCGLNKCDHIKNVLLKDI